MYTYTAFAKERLIERDASKTTPSSGTIYQKNGYAIGEYNPAAYFMNSKPVKGFKKYAYTMNGVTWLFSSQKHMDMFVHIRY